MLRRMRLLAAAFALAMGVMPARATWSIIIVDTRTGEIAIGSATCLLNFDLKKGLPVVRPMIGAAAAQSAIDAGAVNRKKIWDQFALGTAPADMLPILAAGDNNFQKRQYGIVDVRGRSLTFTGAQCGPFAGGKTGQFGTLVYSIQGNVITGQPVIDLAEAALIAEPGGLPDKLMAAMEAARSVGGDGRCSCSSVAPDSCGAPPPNFDPNDPHDKSAHIGFMIVARDGDPEGVCISAQGCANGGYYMVFNVLSNSSALPDPVVTLREQFEAWRLDIIGDPDAILSLAACTPAKVLNSGQATSELLIELRDWQGNPALKGPDVTVSHAAGSAGSSSIGEPQSLGGGKWRVPLSAGTAFGVDRFRVEVSYGLVTRALMPPPQLVVHDQRCDLNRDGAVNDLDLSILVGAYQKTGAGDVNDDGITDQRDLAHFLSILALGE